MTKIIMTNTTSIEPRRPRRPSHRPALPSIRPLVKRPALCCMDSRARLHNPSVGSGPAADR
ncbi:hypothetical protein IMZ48_09200 [Candidatus Bathyarchaeota archaeon]|nr:hypothetical protein [Candidatus Bathyarchaeota archaeon]